MLSKSKNSKKFLGALLFLILIFALTALPVSAAKPNSEREVILGGTLFGVKMQTKGVPIVSVDRVETSNGAISPAYDAGLKPMDIITKVNGQQIISAKAVLNLIVNSGGKEMVLTVQRGEELKNLTLKPVLATDGKYHAGIWIRDSAAGIGTVTYIDPQTNEFAGLGHGICDSDTGCLLPLSRGLVTEVELSGIVKGQKGGPGEIQGAFKGSKIGSLTDNTQKGVYGIYSTIPSGVGQKIKVAELDEVRDGAATIRCAVSGQPKDYKVEIKKLGKSSSGKNYSIKVTDAELLSITGGIVQGMSGSPIVQNGKLIGAVTHVTINNPAEGYGIFIGNMLS